MKQLLGGWRQAETGAVALIAAVLLAGGALIGFLALVVDTGTLNLERRVIQNASEAAALAVAQRCAERSTECDSSESAKVLATTFASLNSPDQLSATDFVCGSSLTNLGNCPTLSSSDFDCRAVPNPYLRFARIATRSSAASESSRLIVPMLSRLRGSNEGYSIRACSQVAWGKTAAAPVSLPIVLPLGNYLDRTSVMIRLFEDNTPYSCDSDPTTSPPACDPIVTIDNAAWPITKLPSGFSFVRLPNSDTNCLIESVIGVNDVLSRQPAASNVCLLGYLGKNTFLPAVTNVSGGLGALTFQVSAFFSFKLRAYKIGNNAPESLEPALRSSTLWSNAGCTASTSCVYGDFKRGVAKNQRISFDPNLPNVGVQAMELLP